MKKRSVTRNGKINYGLAQQKQHLQPLLVVLLKYVYLDEKTLKIWSEKETQQSYVILQSDPEQNIVLSKLVQTTWQ